MAEKALALRLADVLEAADADINLLDDAIWVKTGPSTLDAAAAELRRLHAEVEDLKRTLAASCDEERSQLWEAGPGGGCARALDAEFKCAELLEALRLVVHLNERDVPMTDEELRVCRAAIARAEGEKT